MAHRISYGGEGVFITLPGPFERSARESPAYLVSYIYKRKLAYTSCGVGPHNNSHAVPPASQCLFHTWPVSYLQAGYLTIICSSSFIAPQAHRILQKYTPHVIGH